MSASDVGMSCEWLASELVKSRLLERGHLTPIVSDFRQARPDGGAREFAEHLVAQRLLSQMQAERALAGDARKLVLGPYIMVESIGTGSMGTVYRALGRADRKDYAVKVLPLRSLWNVRLARKQVRAFSEVPEHAGVVPFLDVGSAIGVHYLVWPFAQGKTLDKFVAGQGPLPYAEAARVATQAADALQECHSRRLVHGSVKPSNVLIAPDGQVKLLDFGIGALLAENIGDEESLIDTISTANATSNMLDCIAPEVFVDPTKRAPAGDQYSLGCTLYFAVTGRYPFPEGNAVEKMVAHQTDKPVSVRDLRPDIPSSLAGAIECLMEKSPDSRFRNLHELVNVLAPLARTAGVEEEAIQARAPGRPAMPKAAPATAPAMRPTPPRDEDEEDVLLSPAGTEAGPRTMKMRSGPNVPRPNPPRPAADDRGPETMRMRGRPPQPAAAAPDDGPQTMRMRGTPEALPVADPYEGESAIHFPKREAPAAAPEVPAAQRLALRPAPRQRGGAVERLFTGLQFWRPKADPVQCSVFGNLRVRAGEVVNLQAFCHHPDASATVQMFAATMPPTTYALGSAHVLADIERECRYGLFLDMQSSQVDRQLQESIWNGQLAMFSFQVRVGQVRPGPLHGLVSFGVGRTLLGQVGIQLEVVG